MGDRDNCAVSEHVTSQCGLQHRIGLNVYCGL